METPTLEYFKVAGILFKVTSVEDKTVEVAHKNYVDNIVIPSTVDYNGTTYAVTAIGDNAFSDCSRLESIVIPDSVTSIGEFAFEMCEGLKSVVIPNSVTKIGKGAFTWCEGLTSIDIPNSVTEIGESAFSGSGLESIISNIPADKLFPIGWDVFEDTVNSNCTLYVPKGAKEVYAKTAGWRSFKNIVELAE